MKTTTKLITPEWAKEVLAKRNPNNRKLMDNTVLSYAIDMENDRWTLTHQGIAFDEDDNLVDGQHRLAAVVLSGCSIEMMVTTGVPRQEKRGGVIIKAIDNVDRMSVRTVGQQLQVAHGYKNGASVAAAAGAIARLAFPHRQKMSTAQTLAILNLYGSDIQNVLALLDTRHMGRYFTGPATLFYAVSPKLTGEFIHQWMTLENPRSPVRTMIKWLERNCNASQPEPAMKVVCSCLYRFHLGHDLLKIYPSEEGRAWILEQQKQNVAKIRKMFSGMMREVEQQEAA